MRMDEKHHVTVEIEADEGIVVADGIRVSLVQAVRELLFNVVNDANDGRQGHDDATSDETVQIEVRFRRSGSTPPSRRLRTQRRLRSVRHSERAVYLGGQLRIESARDKAREPSSPCQPARLPYRQRLSRSRK